MNKFGRAICDYLVFLILFGFWFINVVNIFDPNFTSTNNVAYGRFFSAMAVLPGIVWGFIDTIVISYNYFIG